MAPSRKLKIFAVSAPGVEKILAAELAELGIAASGTERGGVSFEGGEETVYKANLFSRTATRLLVRMSEFHASSFAELERRARKVGWTDFLPPDGEIAFRVTCRKSRLYHSDAVAERLAAAIARVRPDLKVRLVSDEMADEGTPPASVVPPQLFIVRLSHDVVTISADSSGELLHRRGYRLEATRASLRETLAAAMLLGSGWTGDEALLDPLCGSGTIAIEAALIARRMAPGLSRSFAFERWSSFDASAWRTIRENATTSRRGGEISPIFASDRDAGAIGIAGRNAERAGVHSDIEFRQRSLAESLADLEMSGFSRACIITNPPYGMRVSGGAGLVNLYGMIGARAKRNAWGVSILTPDETLVRQSGLPSVAAFRTQNGGIPVALFSGRRASVSRDAT